MSQGYGSVVTGQIDAQGAIEGRTTGWGGMFDVEGPFSGGAIIGVVVHPDDCRYPFALTKMCKQQANVRHG